MRIVLIVLYFIIFHSSFGQENGGSKFWNYGEIKTHDGEVYNGIILYADRSYVVTFLKDTISDDRRILQKKDIFSLTFIDGKNKLKRSFASFSIPLNGEDEIILFEILKQFETWAILELKSTRSVQSNDFVGGINTTTTIQVPTEEYYIIDQYGKIKLFLVSEERGGVIKEIRKWKDKELFLNCLDPFKSDVMKFADKNKLNLKERNDLLTVLDYYESLAEQE